MKKLTIRARVVLWYTIFICLILVLALAGILVASREVMKNDLYEEIADFVERNSRQIEWDDDELEIDDDFRNRENGKICLLYDENGALLAGQIPDDLHLEPYAFVEDREVSFPARGRTYYLYDSRLELENGQTVWLRGLIYDRETERVMRAAIKTVFLLLPLFLAAAAAGGYLILKRAFQPIEMIIRTAEEINESRDLSKRIVMEQRGDEVSRLARNFNNMIERLETEFEMEKQFTANVSHELRTPVTVILSQCEIEQGENMRQEEREAFEVIERQARRMSMMISRFLMFTRLEQGVERIKKEPVDLSALVRSVCGEKNRLEQGSHELMLEIPEAVVAAVDRDMIARLLLNLLDNAYKYGKRQGCIRVSLQEGAKEICLAVQNEGEGIPREEQEKIWNRFYQSRRENNYNGGGIGLGLFMVKEIARLHQGRMEVESRPGEGCIFRMFLKREEF